MNDVAEGEAEVTGQLWSSAGQLKPSDLHLGSTLTWGSLASDNARKWLVRQLVG